jgi:hypothetical protein
MVPETIGWNSYGFTTNNWWWKGNVQIWWNDSAGNTHTFQASVPVNDEPSPGMGPYPITDWTVVFAPEYNPSVDHVGTLPQGVQEVKLVSGGNTVQPSPGEEKFVKPSPGGQAEKPRHGKHEETPLRGEQEVKPQHSEHAEKPRQGDHEEKPPRAEREEKPQHGKLTRP